MHLSAVRGCQIYNLLMLIRDSARKYNRNRFAKTQVSILLRIFNSRIFQHVDKRQQNKYDNQIWHWHIKDDVRQAARGCASCCDWLLAVNAKSYAPSSLYDCHVFHLPRGAVHGQHCWTQAERKNTHIPTCTSEHTHNSRAVMRTQKEWGGGGG